jgi:hypothetical protein
MPTTQTKEEALKFFALLTLEEAHNSLNWHRARSTGGQHVGVARMSFGVAERIIKDATALGLRLEYQPCDPPIVVWTEKT